MSRWAPIRGSSITSSIASLIFLSNNEIQLSAPNPDLVGASSVNINGTDYNITTYNNTTGVITLSTPVDTTLKSKVEVDGDLTKNIKAFEDIILLMKDCGVGYGSINHPVDRCPVCNYVGVIGDVCPRCGRRDGEGVSIERLKKLGVGCICTG